MRYELFLLGWMKGKTMGTKINAQIFFLLIVFFFQVSFLTAQPTYKILIISPKVGEVIDKSEKDYFHLFQTIKGFEQGIFFVDTSNSYYGLIEYINQNGIKCDTVINYSEAYLIRTSELIDNFEKVAAGGYQFTRSEFSFPTIDDKNNLLAAITLTSNIKTENKSEKITYKDYYKQEFKNSDLLELSDNKIDIDLNYYPRLGFGIGFSTPLSTEDINNIITSVENIYRNQGYDIRYNKSENNNAGYLWLNLKVLLTKNITISLNTGSTVSEDEPNLKSVAIYGFYRYDLFKLHWFQPYAGLGVSSNVISLDQDFPYYDRVSPIDTSGGYDYLSSIQIQGEAKSIGLNFLIGIELVGSFTGLNLYTDYALINSFNVKSNSDPESYTMNFSGFTYGIILSVYF
jgi:hypothetical protein